MSFDATRNAQELGQGIPLYTVGGDLNANVSQNEFGGDTVSPTANTLTFGSPALNNWILVALIVLVIINLFNAKGR